MLILRDPSSTEGGSGGSAPPPVANVPERPTITLDVTRFQQLAEAENALRTVQASQREAVEKAEKERLDALAAKGEAEKILAELRDKSSKAEQDWAAKYGAIEAAYHGEKKAAVVGSSLSGVQWVSDEARSQALQLLDSQLTVSRNADGSAVVVHKLTGRPAEQAIGELIASPAFAHFQLPKSKGGAGATGGNYPAPTKDDPPMTYEQAIIAQWKSRNDNPALPSWQQRAKYVRN